VPDFNYNHSTGMQWRNVAAFLH